jgi:hypothetical protein
MRNREHATWRTDYRTSADVRQGTTRRARPLNEKFDNSLFASGGAQVPINAVIAEVPVPKFPISTTNRELTPQRCALTFLERPTKPPRQILQGNGLSSHGEIGGGMKTIVTTFLLSFLSCCAFAQDKRAISAAEVGCGPQDAKFEVKSDGSQHPAPTPENGKALIYVVADGHLTTM